MPSTDIKKGLDWFTSKRWTPFAFQLEAWESYSQGLSGLVNAPTGSGKTFSLLIPILLEGLAKENTKQLQSIWITPIRALGKEIEYSAKEAIDGLDSSWKVGVRTGDSSFKQKQRQLEKPPEFLITTPESLHLLLTQKNYTTYFKELKSVVVDEWHELLGSKRGVLMELALSRLKTVAPGLKIWGISATIGNMEQSMQVLLGDYFQNKKKIKIIRAEIEKKIEIISVFPDEVERLPWSGHLGIVLLEKVIPIILRGKSTLIFTNTRSFAEIWYQKLLDKAPELAGVIAMHHGSISAELRNWVEDQLHEGKLKAVVCTSSLDLGVDFRPVETIIQVGSPKGVARFLQRAGRSGHQPNATSRIYFLPTNSLELTEAAALREAMNKKIVEDRIPYIRSFDVLIQYLVTIAVSDGFRNEELFEEIRSTYCYREITGDEWQQILHNLTSGGNALQQYDEYKKVEIIDGVYRVTSRKIAMRHRLHIGTIVSEPMMKVQLLHGGFIGVIEEWFISRLTPGEVFSLAGRKLEYVSSKDMTAYVRKSSAKKSIVPSWQGGRMPLSANLGKKLRETLNQAGVRSQKSGVNTSNA